MTDHEIARLDREPGRQVKGRLQVLLYSTICIALFAVLYAPAYRAMISSWEAEDYNYCYLVPLIVLYIIWEKRTAFRDAAQQPSWLGVLPLVSGVMLYWLGELGGEYYTLYLSSWLVMLGMVWTYFGWRKLKTIGFALCLLIAMFPFPKFITGNLTLRLKLISSQLGVGMLQLCGFSAYREGNVIDLGFTRLQVVDACSGLRFFLPLIILGILLSYYYRAAWWKRGLLIISAIPLSIVTNSLRIASVGVLYQFIGPRAAEGFFHDFSGWFIFMVSLSMLLSFMWCLKRIFPEQAQVDGNSNSSPPPPQAGEIDRNAGFGYALLLAVPAMVMLGGTILVTRNVDFREKVPLRKSFADFPVQAGEWRGERQVMEKMILDALDLSDYVMVNYRNGKGNRMIDLYCAYNETQSKGKSSHSPASCLPGSGWEFKDTGSTTVALPDGKTISVMRAAMVKNGQQQLMYYWFPQRGRILHNLFELKFYAFWDALTSRRTDGALIRVISPVYDPANPKEADIRLQGFVRTILPILDQYIPGRTIR